MVLVLRLVGVCGFAASGVVLVLFVFVVGCASFSSVMRSWRASLNSLVRSWRDCIISTIARV